MSAATSDAACDSILLRFQRLRQSIPPQVRVVVAAKTRSLTELREVIAAGAVDVGYNYVQEAIAMKTALGAAADKLRWHCIGHLQRNKIGKALDTFDTIQTVDSVACAAAIDHRVTSPGRRVPVLIEINSGREPAKHGLAPDAGECIAAARAIARLPRLELRGLMTMGPAQADAGEIRPYFRRTAELFNRLRDALPGLALDTLSMGMSDSYRTAIEESATMLRLGSVLFGDRPPRH